MGEKRFSEGLLCAVLFVGVCFGVVAGAAIYASAYPVFQSQNWAAWVQAVGSVGAILGAASFTRRQISASQQLHLDAIRHANERDKRQSISQVEGACAVFNRASTFVLHTQELLDKRTDDRGTIRLVSRLLKLYEAPRSAMERIPLHEHPYSHISVPAMSLSMFFDEYVERLAGLKKIDPDEDGGAERLEVAIAGLKGLSEKVMSYTNKLKTRALVYNKA